MAGKAEKGELPLDKWEQLEEKGWAEDEQQEERGYSKIIEAGLQADEEQQKRMRIQEAGGQPSELGNNSHRAWSVD